MPENIYLSPLTLNSEGKIGLAEVWNEVCSFEKDWQPRKWPAREKEERHQQRLDSGDDSGLDGGGAGVGVVEKVGTIQD